LSPFDLKLDQGKGRVFVILHQVGRYDPYHTQLTSALLEHCRVVHLEMSAGRVLDYNRLVDELHDKIKALGLRQFSFVAFGSCCTLAQLYALRHLRSLRTLVLIDASPRPSPGILEQLSDWLEKILPLGLPLRGSTKGFLGTSFLQRIRCPTLLILSPNSGSYTAGQFDQMLDGLPTAWGLKIKDWSEFDDIEKAVLEFQQVPAKCPQKNRASTPQVTGQQAL